MGESKKHFVGQIVKQGMQVRFDQGSCFIEKEGRLIAHGRRESRMFILDSHEMKSTMIAKGTKADSDIELWYKWIGHINLNKLKAMRSKGVVIGLPTFGKQHQHPFPKERNVSKGLLDVRSMGTGSDG